MIARMSSALDDYLLEVMATPTESLFAADLAIVLDDRRALRTKTG